MLFSSEQPKLLYMAALPGEVHKHSSHMDWFLSRGSKGHECSLNRIRHFKNEAEETGIVYGTTLFKSRVKCILASTVFCECESWTVKKAEHRSVDAFKLWCWRRLLSPLDCREIKPVNPKGNQS